MAGESAPGQLGARGERAAGAAGRSGAVDALARAGLAARGLLYAVLAILVVEVVVGRGGQETDRKGAVEAIAAHPAGSVLVGLLAAGLAGHALWRWLDAAGASDRSLPQRFGSAVVGVFYAGVAAATALVLAGRSHTSENRQSQRGTAELLSVPLGRPAVVLTGVVLAGIGVGLAWWALKARYERKLDTAAMGGGERRVLRVLELAGQWSRAALLFVAGGLVIRAGVEADPGRSQGVDGTLRTLAAQTGGSLLLVVIALGLLGFAVASFLEARRLRTGSDRSR